MRANYRNEKMYFSLTNIIKWFGSHFRVIKKKINFILKDFFTITITKIQSLKLYFYNCNCKNTKLFNLILFCHLKHLTKEYF